MPTATQKTAAKKETSAAKRTRLAGLIRSAKLEIHHFEVAIGGYVTDVKTTWKESETPLFLAWVKATCGLSKSTAYRYMKAYAVDQRVPGASVAFDGNTTTMEWADRLTDSEIASVIEDKAVKANPTLENVKLAALRVSVKQQGIASRKDEASADAEAAAEVKLAARDRQIRKAIDKTLAANIAKLLEVAQTDPENALRLAMLRGAVYVAAYPKDVGIAKVALEACLKGEVKADADAVQAQNDAA